MSRILEKAFDASKKIIRSIFKGTPNLLTSSDINRQFEAIKHQLDQIDSKTGVISDITLNEKLLGSTLGVSVVYTYLRFKGCEFSPKNVGLNINFTKTSSPAYLCLVAETELVTYESDYTHEIAGAKFEDGTSLPAANQLRYKNEAFVLTHSLSSVENLVGIIAKFSLSDTGSLITEHNTVAENDSLALNKRKTIVNFNPATKGKVSNGKDYDMAFSILENRFTNVAPNWTPLVDVFGNSTDSSFRIQNGVLYLNTKERKFDVISTRAGVTRVALGYFPNTVKDSIIAFLKTMGLDTLNAFVGGSQEKNAIPYGEFGCFPIYSAYVGETSTFGEMHPMFGMAKVVLMLEYDGTNEIRNAYIGAYINCMLKFAPETKNYEFEAPFVEWYTTGNEVPQIFIPRMIGAIPLFGPL